MEEILMIDPPPPWPSLVRQIAREIMLLTLTCDHPVPFLFRTDTTLPGPRCRHCSPGCPVAPPAHRPLHHGAAIRGAADIAGNTSARRHPPDQSQVSSAAAVSLSTSRTFALPGEQDRRRRPFPIPAAREPAPVRWPPCSPAALSPPPTPLVYQGGLQPLFPAIRPASGHLPRPHKVLLRSARPGTYHGASPPPGR